MAGTSLKARSSDPTDESVKKTDLFKVDPRILDEETGFNLRDYNDPEVKEHIEAFAQSYSEGKFVPPLVVRTDSDGNVLVVEGHCRRRGALLAIKRGVELPYVTALSFNGNDAERVEVMLRSADGLKLKPLAVALGYLRLQRMNYSNTEIAQRVRKTASHVEQMLLLATADHDVQELVRSEKVKASTAIEAIRAHREKAGAYLRGKLGEAHERGKATVTRSAVTAWTPSRKIVVGMLGGLEAVVAGLDKRTRAEVARMEGMEPEQLKGRKIEVDAGSMLELMRAHVAVSEARTARETKERADREAASQGKLDIEGGVT